MKYFLFTLLIFVLNSCVSSQNLNLDEEIKLNNEKKFFTYDNCTNFSYISNSEDSMYGKIFKEYIRLDSSCKWNGLQRGYFVDLFKDTIKVKSLKLVERIENKNLEISTYLIDEKYYVNIINKFTVFEDLLIIDYKGIYSTRLISGFNKEYKNIYLDKPRLDSNYSNSLVRMNFMKGYFARESESFDN